MKKTEFLGLKEALMVGAQTSAKSLASYLGQEVNVGTSDLMLLPIEAIAATLGHKEELVTAVLLHVTGDIEGEYLYIFNEEGATRAQGLLTARHRVVADRSALQELANIVSGNGFTEIDEYFGIETAYSIPGIAYDMFGSVTDPVIAALGAHGENVFLVRTEYITGGKPLFKTFFFANSISTTALMRKLESKNNHGADH